MESPQLVCATVAVGGTKKDGDGNVLLERIVSSLYETCRANPDKKLIASFPDFGPLLSELDIANKTEGGSTATYEVTALHPTGALVVKESFFQQFGEGDHAIKEFEEVVAAHNAIYNKDCLRLASESDPAHAPDDAQRSGSAMAVVQTNQDLTADVLANMELS